MFASVNVWICRRFAEVPVCMVVMRQEVWYYENCRIHFRLYPRFICLQSILAQQNKKNAWVILYVLCSSSCHKVGCVNVLPPTLMLLCWAAGEWLDPSSPNEAFSQVIASASEEPSLPLICGLHLVSGLQTVALISLHLRHTITATPALRQDFCKMSEWASFAKVGCWAARSTKGRLVSGSQACVLSSNRRHHLTKINQSACERWVLTSLWSVIRQKCDKLIKQVCLRQKQTLSSSTQVTNATIETRGIQ